jgi:adenylate cyclase
MTKSTKNKGIRKKPLNISSNGNNQLRQMETLLNVSRQVAAFENLDDMLKVMVELSTKEVGGDRGTLFLNDEETGELYSRVTHGNTKQEIRILNNSGIAGHVFSTGKSAITHDAYSDEYFERSIDKETGYLTKSVLCAPIRTVKGEVIGVIQILNKLKGRFTKKDLQIVEAMTTQAALTLKSAQLLERMRLSSKKEMEFLDVVSDVTSEINLKVLLQKVMKEATRMLKAERSTLFLNDIKTNQLWSEVGEGLHTSQIRLPNHVGIAGAVFTTGKTINIPYAYADMRFNPKFDKETGFFTRSILCVPVVNKVGEVIGVTQVLNKQGGPFTSEDESRLKAFTSQISIGLENAKLFNDVQNMKNYNESMLESMSNGVITINEEGKIITCNSAGLEIMQVSLSQIIGQKTEEFFSGANEWILEKIKRVEEIRESEIFIDAEMVFAEETSSINLTILPLISAEQEVLGTMIMMEDISSEKRMKSTMSRYMDPGIADQLLKGGDDFLGGASIKATVLFSDIRGFTTLTEELGAQGTVALLNEYFTLMVECITREGGMLDKFIGDAIMAAFGIPVAHDDDEDRALRAAIGMIKEMFAWNKERISGGQKPIDMGLGLNTDTVVSGNIGSPKRMDYTIIGDGVNLAARLESACKQYSARIIISVNTFDKLKGTYRIRYIDDVVVKGKTEPVGIYEVLDYHTDETFPNVMDVVNYFNEGRKHYRSGNWDKAIDNFQQALRFNPEDNLSNIYIERCEILKKDTPTDWDGVWKMTTK